MTKDSGDLTQFNTVACREHSLPREEAASQPKEWIQRNKIGPVLEVATSYLHCKHGVEAETTLTPGSGFLMDQIGFSKNMI